MKSTFDEVCAAMEAPDHPAACDLCGREGTNASLQDHVCGVIGRETIEQAHAEVREALALKSAREVIRGLQSMALDDYGVWKFLDDAQSYVLNRQKELFDRRFREQ